MIIVAVAGLTLVSCKKNYTCTCTYSSKAYDDGVVWSTSNLEFSESTGKKKKKDAEKECTEDNGTIMSGDKTWGTETTTDCKLK